MACVDKPVDWVDPKPPKLNALEVVAAGCEPNDGNEKLVEVEVVGTVDEPNEKLDAGLENIFKMGINRRLCQTETESFARKFTPNSTSHCRFWWTQTYLSNHIFF